MSCYASATIFVIARNSWSLAAQSRERLYALPCGEPEVRIHLSILSTYRKTVAIASFYAREQKGFCPPVLSLKEGAKKTRLVRSSAGKTSTIRGRRSIRTATRRPPILRNALLPDGSPAVKEDVERYLLGHAGTD